MMNRDRNQGSNSDNDRPRTGSSVGDVYNGGGGGGGGVNDPNIASDEPDRHSMREQHNSFTRHQKQLRFIRSENLRIGIYF